LQSNYRAIAEDVLTYVNSSTRQVHLPPEG